MGGYLKAFFVPVGILALIKVNNAFVASVNNISVVPNQFDTTEEEYVTDSLELFDITEEEYVTDSPELLGTTEEEYVTDDLELLGTTEEEYVTDGPELLGTTEEEYVANGPNHLGTIKEEHVINASEVLGNTQKPSVSYYSVSKEHKSCSYLYILLIIIGILTILCTIFLVSTIALAYQSSNLKAKLQKRSTRSNSDFIKTASLWSNGLAQLPGEAGETNVTLEEVKPLKEEDEAKLARSAEGTGGES